MKRREREEIESKMCSDDDDDDDDSGLMLLLTSAVRGTSSVVNSDPAVNQDKLIYLRKRGRC